MAPRKPAVKKAVTKRVTKKAPVSQEVAIVTVPVEEKHELVLEGDPEQQLEFAQKAASALMSVVKQKPNPVMIRGKQYLEFGDWQTLARFFGATVGTEWSKPIEKDGWSKTFGYEARMVVHQKGDIISSAEAMVTRDEKRWKDADDYAIKSMAQTRAGAKALRNAFGWVAELAGYASTPLEEMDGVDRDPAPQPSYSRPAPSYGGGVVDRNDEPFPSSPKPTAPPAPMGIDEKKRILALQLRKLGHEMKGMTKAAADELVLKYTALPATVENFDEIITRMDVRIKEREEAGGSPLADEFRTYDTSESQDHA